MIPRGPQEGDFRTDSLETNSGYGYTRLRAVLKRKGVDERKDCRQHRKK